MPQSRGAYEGHVTGWYYAAVFPAWNHVTIQLLDSALSVGIDGVVTLLLDATVRGSHVSDEPSPLPTGPFVM